MERFYKDQTRRANHARQVECGDVFSFEQIDDVLDLIAQRKWPDGTFGDSECVLWARIRDKLGIKYW